MYRWSRDIEEKGRDGLRLFRDCKFNLVYVEFNDYILFSRILVIVRLWDWMRLFMKNI